MLLASLVDDGTVYGAGHGPGPFLVAGGDYRLEHV